MDTINPRHAGGIFSVCHKKIVCQTVVVVLDRISGDERYQLVMQGGIKGICGRGPSEESNAKCHKIPDVIIDVKLIYILFFEAFFLACGEPCWEYVGWEHGYLRHAG